MPATIEEPNASIARRLKRERVAADLSSEQVARAGGVSRSTQFAYENGESVPDAGYLALLRDASIGIDVWFVLTGERERTSSQITSRERVHLDRFNDLPPNLRDVVERVMTVAEMASANRKSSRVEGGDTHYHAPVENAAGRDVHKVTHHHAPAAPAKAKKPKPPKA